MIKIPIAVIRQSSDVMVITSEVLLNVSLPTSPFISFARLSAITIGLYRSIIIALFIRVFATLNGKITVGSISTTA